MILAIDFIGINVVSQLKSVAKLVALLLVWVFFRYLSLEKKPGGLVFSILLAWNNTSGFPTLISLLFLYRASA